MRNPIVAAILSVIVAGLGQIYNGQIGKGVVFTILQLINIYPRGYASFDPGSA